MRNWVAIMALAAALSGCSDNGNGNGADSPSDSTKPAEELSASEAHSGAGGDVETACGGDCLRVEVGSESETLVRDFVAFARAPGGRSFFAIPWADRLWLGLATASQREVPSSKLRQPLAWRLPEKHFDGWSGPFSALRTIDDGPTKLSASSGRHKHCAGPPIRSPKQVRTLHQISIQPAEYATCLDWFAVDLFVDETGEVRAVQLELFGP